MKKKSKTLIWISIIAVLVVIFVILSATGVLDILKDVEKLQNWLAGFGALSYLVYIGIFVIGTVFLLPASVFTIVGGLLFGPLKGTALALAAATLSAAISFLMTRYFARDYMVKKFKDKKLFKAMEKGIAQNGVEFVMITRLIPIFPHNIQGYAYGLTNISFLKYVLVSAVAMIPGAFLYAYFAGQLVITGVTPMFIVQLVIASFLFYLLFRVVKRIAKKRGIPIEGFKEEDQDEFKPTD